MHKDVPGLDGMYASFGKVVEGMDVVDKIAKARTGFGDKPLKPQRIGNIAVDTFGQEYEEPEVL